VPLLLPPNGQNVTKWQRAKRHSMRSARSQMVLSRSHYWTPGIAVTIAANGGNNVRKDADINTNTNTAVATTNSTPALPNANTFYALVKKAEKGDTKALAEVRQWCKQEPKLWDTLAIKAASSTRYSLLSLLTGDNAVAHDALDYEMQAMQRELLGTFPSPLEKLLVERICSCYLQVQYAESIYAQKAKGSISFTHGDYLQRQVDRANQRYAAAIRALALVRRLLTPVVQVNVAEKQINLAGPQTSVLSVASSAAASATIMDASGKDD